MPKPGSPSTGTSNDSLCLHCALCCNGVLFDDVKLRPDENVEALMSMGIPIRNPSGRTPKFLQPCSCLHGTSCQVYAQRPAQCRAFECRLLQRVANGERSRAEAMATIQRAKGAVRAVERQLEASGEGSLQRGLGWRYARVMRSPMDLDTDPDAAETRGRLMRAMDRLMRVLQREFLGTSVE